MPDENCVTKLEVLAILVCTGRDALVGFHHFADAAYQMLHTCHSKLSQVSTLSIETTPPPNTRPVARS
jgi:hypothetical protein